MHFDHTAGVLGITRITRIVQPAIVLVGNEVVVPTAVVGTVWPLAEVIKIRSAAAGAGSRRLPRPGPPSPREPRPPDPHRLAPSSLAEIIFTSGATAEPKGVTITHRNVLANIVPIEREMQKYRRYARPFHPMRFLNLLPLSHMFGQSMATFVPPMLGGHRRLLARLQPDRNPPPDQVATHLGARLRAEGPRRPARAPRARRARTAGRRPARGHGTGPGAGGTYRRVHRLFGWKFWCVVCGAAPLDPALEAFWRKLGFLVVQGYGLTETAPIVTLNHPFRASRGHGRHADRRRRGADCAGRRDPRARRERDVRLLPAGGRRRCGSDRGRRGVRRTAGSTPATSANWTRQDGC